ncbi:MAG: YncE family protein, partial [Candidatus Thermoplasmatota archaeon]|nr:YncE family protein [Candidatus Thermoplasmatota archaeon]
MEKLFVSVVKQTRFPPGKSSRSKFGKLLVFALVMVVVVSLLPSILDAKGIHHTSPGGSGLMNVPDKAYLSPPPGIVTYRANNTFLLFNSSTVPGSLLRTGQGIGPIAVAYDPQTKNLYVANNMVDNVSVINSTTNEVTASIYVGAAPSAVAYDQYNNYVYVTNYLSNNVSVINPSNDRVINTISLVGQIEPNGIAYDPSDNEMYVVDSSANVSIIGTGNTVTATVAVGHHPIGIAYSPVTGGMYVANDGSGNVSVIKGSSIYTTVNVGVDPYAVAYDPYTTDIYVSNYLPGNVSVIHTVSVITSINVGNNPEGLAYDPTTQDLYVSNLGSHNLSVIGSGNTVTHTINLGSLWVEPVGMAYDASNGFLYVANNYGANLTLIDGSDYQVVGVVSVGFFPSGIVYDNLNGYYYVGSFAGSSVHVINAASNSLVTIVKVGIEPRNLAFDPYHNQVYASNYQSDNVTVINATTNHVAKNIGIGSGPQGIAYDSDSHNVYVIWNSHISEINTTTNVVATFFAIPSSAQGIIYDPYYKYLYVAVGLFPGNVYVFDPNGNPQFTINVGNEPYNLACDPSTGDIYVSNLASNNISVISYSAVIANVSVGSGPFGVVYNPLNKDVYTANGGSNNVSVISTVSKSVISTINTGEAPQSVGYDSTNGNLLVGERLSGAILALSPVEFATTFSETGLSSGSWYVNITGFAPSGPISGSSYSKSIYNGTFAYTVATSNKIFEPSLYSGSLLISGTPKSVAITFSKVTYAVKFSETGLPSGSWYVNLTGSNSSGPISGNSYSF